MSETPQPANTLVGVLVADLLFSTRISAEAKAAGVPLQHIRQAQSLGQLAPQVRLLIADLNMPGAIAAAVEWRDRSHGSVVGFVSHVDTPTIHTAREAGIDRILPRSRFVKSLPELLRGSD